ncbi:hypothetical protein PPTG_07117 [Phytophthora nicotianae INRA-310]|uniref:RxLR effector protein n=1 Tax=Phytophthora nicotianae (strain INRA-310) TaxID=761204 RepID=W2QNW2_PHYN3|nr:hypothetical protein PPTG_07117 [Phytophthora nicotianae INRA-310]ETN14867.1 hypothetical protein PPTG_07117 [Phytophthora nicotianae INRA-310]
MTKLKAFLSKVDEMDEKAAQMIKGKTVEESGEILTKLWDDVLPLLENTEGKGITPQNLGNHPTFKNYLTRKLPT